MIATRETLTERTAKLRLELLRTHDVSQESGGKPLRLDGILLSDMTSIAYITGFTGSTALALLMPESAYLIVDSRYTNQAKQECKHFDIVQTETSASQAQSLAQVVARYSQKLRLGFEADHVTVAKLSAYKELISARVKLKPAPGFVGRLRAIKDADEITAIRAAIRLAESAFKKCARFLAPGIAEERFAAELDIAMIRAGANKPAFDTIVASGPNGARPHHGTSSRAFEAGDLVTIDWGARLNGYCSDLTRTVLIGAEPMEGKQRDVYETVLKAKNLATAAIRPGVTGKSIDDIARSFISERGYGDHFGHSLGHGLGIDVHDGLTLSQRAENVVLQPGMVTTVEPGIYIDGWGGIRIEDDVLVTDSGHESLSIQAE
jgi:Xaa-Pro aminopeptidase